MELTFQQKKQLLQDGYVRIPGVVPRMMVKEAVKAINHSIGKGSIPADHKGANYCKELQNQAVITDLFNKTPAKELCDSLIGKDAYHPVNSAQIALRFPEYIENRPDDWGAHLDGVLRVHEGIAYNFTLLAGIILSDQRETFSGNFTVYPGTHHQYEQYFKDNGPDILFREESFRDKHRSLNVPLPWPVQITGEPGDMIIAHYQLIHAGGLNTSEKVRYSCYFRVDHKDRMKDWMAPLLDLWLHWPAIQAVKNEQDKSSAAASP